jgi:hypothetical protein
MIEDKDVKVAENPEEAFWTTFKKQCLKNIENHNREIIINEELVKLADKKVSEVK